MMNENMKVESRKRTYKGNLSFTEPKQISCKECKYRMYSASGNVCTKFECYLDGVPGCSQGEKGTVEKNCSTCKYFVRAYTKTAKGFEERPYGECHAFCNAIYGENRCCNDRYSCAGWQMGETE